MDTACPLNHGQIQDIDFLAKDRVEFKKELEIRR